MAKCSLMLGGFTKLSDTLCDSSFATDVVSRKISLTAEGDQYVVEHISPYHNVEYYRAVIFYDSNDKSPNGCLVMIDGVERKIYPGTLIVNNQGKLIVIDAIKSGKHKKASCFLYRFIREYDDHRPGGNDSKDNNPYDTFTIKTHLSCKRNTYYDGYGEPVILELSVIKGNYKFINWYVYNTYTGYTIPPCYNGDNLYNLIYYIQDLFPPQTYAGNFNVGYICEDSAGKQHFVGQYFQQAVPNNEYYEPIDVPYTVNDPVEFPYIINYQQTS